MGTNTAEYERQRYAVLAANAKQAGMSVRAFKASIAGKPRDIVNHGLQLPAKDTGTAST